MSDETNTKAGRIVELFEQGKRFTEDVMRENERLRAAVAAQKTTLKSLEEDHGPESGQLRERIAELIEENLENKRELDGYRRQFAAIEQQNLEFSNRYFEVEHQNTSLVNLYVATQRLHSTFSLSEIVAILEEIIVNLVGSECFEVALFDASAKRLVVIAAEGSTRTKGEELPVGGVLARVLETRAFVVPATPDEALAAGFAACFPLNLGSRCLGAVILRRLLPQKRALGEGDMELFELLGQHVAAALCSAAALEGWGWRDDADAWSKMIAAIAGSVAR